MLIYGLFAAAVAILATISIERMGGRLGGLIATIPTTIIPASTGIFERSENEQAFIWAMAVVPMGMLVNAIFLWLWRKVPPSLPPLSNPMRLLAMLAISLLGWALAASLGLWLCASQQASGVEPLLLGAVTTLILVSTGIGACLADIPAPAGSRRVSIPVLASRGVLAGVCIVLAVWLSELGLPLLSGIFSVFPAIFLTTMVSLWLSQGESVQAGAVGPMMLGSASVAVFALIAVQVFPSRGPWTGAFLSWIGSIVLVSLPAHAWLYRRQQTSSPPVTESPQ
jgi:hypothetical protein